MILFYQPDLDPQNPFLDAEESRHCIKVLRRRNGDEIHVTDGRGHIFSGTISDPSPGKCSFSIKNTVHTPKKPWSVHIAIAPTRHPDRTEWFVEKSVELGIDKITLMECEHSEKTFLKTDRLRKVAVSAMKQSLKHWLPEIAPMVPFEQVISCSDSSRFIAYVDASNPLHLLHAASPGGKYLVLIGPEGDFSPRELELALSHSFTKVSLGTSRLRTETAGFAACHILNLVNS